VQSVSALVLIYDIRGFTAATKRMGTAEIGSFATKAHAAILESFAARPPTFVKNLGDGHLLIWETGPEPDPSLMAAVVDGAARARTAFAAFVAGLGATGAALPRHVGIGVAHGEVSKSDDYYGVALNLAARLQNLARPEGLALDQGVFEAVGRRDAALRDGFRRARVRLKGLGSTTVFVRRPFSWARLLGAIAKPAAVVAVPLLYLALCDAGLGLPGGDAVRLAIDRRDLSVFRAPRRDAEVRAAADGLRRDLSRLLLAARTDHGWFASDVAKKTESDFDVWSSSQTICAILGAPHLDVPELRTTLDGLAVAFDPAHFVRDRKGTAYGWAAHPGTPFTEAEPLFWTIAALARALGRPGVVPPERRDEFLRDLATAQEAARLHHPVEAGGWNMYPNQTNPAGHSPYTTTLAFLALLELRSARLPWEGSEARRDALLRSTAAWFATAFVPGDADGGWRRTQDPLDEVSRGLTFQIDALLLRAEAEAGIPVPEAVLRAATAQIEGLSNVSLGSSSADAGEFSVEFVAHDARLDANGKPIPMKGTEGINFLWHPWAVAAAQAWLDRAARAGVGVAPEDRVRVRRALGWLVVDLADEVRKEGSTGYTFKAAETLYGLCAVPR
jgi:class 3 adenylate cyclase